MKPKFSLVMPLFMQHEYQYHMTIACLNNIKAFTTPPYELIVLHSVSEFKGKHIQNEFLRPVDQYIPFENNPSQAEAVNIGIKKAKGDYITLIGNDNFVHEKWLSEIDKRLGNPQFPILASTVDRNEPEVTKEIFEIHKAQDYIKGVRFSYVNFQGVTISKKIIEDVGLIDENLPFYFWERDYNLRLEEKGYICGAVLTSLMTTPQNMTRMDMVTSEGVENWWSDESNAKEVEYYNKKWPQYI